MSKVEMIRFSEMLSGDEVARNEVKNMGTDFKSIATFASQRGFSLSVSDFSIDEELSEEELRGVAGGRSNYYASGEQVGGFLDY